MSATTDTAGSADLVDRMQPRRPRYTDAQKEAGRQQGWRDYTRGWARPACPFPRWRISASCWQAGWDAAHAAHAMSRLPDRDDIATFDPDWFLPDYPEQVARVLGPGVERGQNDDGTFYARVRLDFGRTVLEGEGYDQAFADEQLMLHWRSHLGWEDRGHRRPLGQRLEIAAEMAREGYHRGYIQRRTELTDTQLDEVLVLAGRKPKSTRRRAR